MRIVARPLMTKLKAVKKAKPTCERWMCEKMRSSPTNEGVIGNPAKLKQTSKKMKPVFGYS